MRTLGIVLLSALLASCVGPRRTCCPPTYTPPAYISPDVVPIPADEPPEIDLESTPLGMTERKDDRTTPADPDATPRTQPPPLGPHYQVAIHVERMRPGTATTRIAAPVLSVQPGAHASVTVGETHSYISDFDAQVTKGAAIADPIVGVIRDGLQVNLLAVPDPDAPATTRLAFHVALADVRERHRRRRVQLGRGVAPGTIELPRVHRSEAVGVVQITGDGRVPLAEVLSPVDGVPVRVLARVTVVGDVSGTTLPKAEDAAGTPSSEGLLGLGQPGGVGDVQSLSTLLAGDRGAARKVRVQLLRISSDIPDPKSLDPATLGRWLANGRPSGRLRIADAGVQGAEARWLVAQNYIQDYDVVVEGAKKKEGAPEGVLPTPEVVKELNRPVPIPSLETFALDPIVGTIAEGYLAKVGTKDGKAMLRLSWATLVSPIPTFRTKIEARTRPITIELPELRVAQKWISLEPGTHDVFLGLVGERAWMAARVTVVD